jgi:hypothetical protein
MQSREKWILFGSLAALFLMAQVLVTQHTIIAQMHLAQRLSDDQINDLAYQLIQRNEECERKNMQQFVAGVVATLERRDEMSAVWHDGYDRGSAVERYAAEIDAKKTAAYTEAAIKAAK